MSTKPGPLRKCSTDGCSTFTAWRHCEKHRRTVAGKTASAAELARRLAEDREQRDSLHDANDQEAR